MVYFEVEKGGIREFCEGEGRKWRRIKEIERLVATQSGNDGYCCIKREKAPFFHSRVVARLGWVLLQGEQGFVPFLNRGCPTSYRTPLRVPSKEIRVTTNGPESPYDFYHGFSWGESNPWMQREMWRGREICKERERWEMTCLDNLLTEVYNRPNSSEAQ